MDFQWYIASQMYQGRTNERHIDVNDTLQYIDVIQEGPFPWSWVNITNNASANVIVGINRPSNKITILPKQSPTINRLRAIERIFRLYYWCEKGQKSRLKLIYEY